MIPSRFDAITKILASHRLSRREAIVQGGAGAVAGALGASHASGVSAAQESTPEAEREGPVLLFLQAFRSGSVASKEGTTGRYTLTLEQGLGHTVYFSDRPDRVVGAMPTPEFLDFLGFPDDNPPNAALVADTGAGQTEVAVLELFTPSYDDATHTATYEAVVLAEWERSPDGSFAESDADLAEVLPEFGAAHLFIDSTVGCGIATLSCWLDGDYIGDIGTLGVCSYNFATDTCDPSTFSETAFQSNLASYTSQCNARYGTCGDNCEAMHLCPPS
jgi:hypothetical protein